MFFSFFFSEGREVEELAHVNENYGTPKQYQEERQVTFFKLHHKIKILENLSKTNMCLRQHHACFECYIVLNLKKKNNNP